MNYETTHDRVVVKRDPRENKTSSGLFIAKLDSDRTDTGIVVQVGPGRITKKNVTIAVEVDVGNRVMFDSGAGINIKLDGEELVILKEDEIIGIVE
jgi:chaperonin GroES